MSLPSPVTEQRPVAKSRYGHLLDIFVRHDPSSMIEIGVWRGDRTVQFLERGRRLRRYVGFDIFEDISAEMYQKESMGQCVPQTKQGILQRIGPIAERKNCDVKIVAGRTEDTLSPFARDNKGAFEFIYIDGGHSIETIGNDWNCAKELISPKGLIVFDDYYLNDDTRGAKRLIDGLLRDTRYRVRFFPVIEDIIEDIQITMVAVWPLSSP